ncbi:MAG: hypothetical protein FJW32_17235 [Acidobacteria bacterium]|nr:hypothetical protein [Acidobacteriota bacterium]
MKLLVFLVRCYPRAFRERFEAEMLEMLGEPGLVRESVGLLRGLAVAWDDAINWTPGVCGIAAAFALHLVAYTVLVPISER